MSRKAQITKTNILSQCHASVAGTDFALGVGIVEDLPESSRHYYANYSYHLKSNIGCVLLHDYTIISLIIGPTRCVHPGNLYLCGI